MKILKLLFTTFLLCFTFSSLLAQKNQAKEGEQVWIITVTVKNEHKSNFEKWISEVMYPALRNSKDKMRQGQLKSTRWLTPAAQNADQTWTYAWIMDPVVTGADYDIPNLLKQAYGEEMANKHWEAYLSYLTKEPEMIALIQTNY
ncbi:MAG: hypothetical protein SFU99_12205 [Saprospiraceae bacterium]|nr:hypothetical protein [Saprospiraceae bacterium]